VRGKGKERGAPREEFREKAVTRRDKVEVSFGAWRRYYLVLCAYHPSCALAIPGEKGWRKHLDHLGNQ
jgi:hypothetical protein